MSFFDTNLMVAAAVPTHPHHAASHARLARLRAAGASCASHSLAETYTTLTHPGRYGISPGEALLYVEEMSRAFEIVSLSNTEYVQALRAAAALGLRGAIVYDALLIACARKVNARWIYTNNVKHFRRVAPDLASRIVEP